MRPDFDALEPLVGEAFQLAVPGVDEPLPATLTIVRTLPRNGLPEDLPVPFFIQFRLAPDVNLPQGTITATHPSIELPDLFTVPIAADQTGFYLEATFN